MQRWQHRLPDPTHPRTFFDRYKALTKRAGWPASFTVHDLRHAQITAMITSKLVDPEAAREMADHLQRAAAATINARFGASSEAA